MSKGDLSISYLIGMALTVAVVILITLLLFGYFPEVSKDIRKIADEVFGREAKLREEQKQQSTELFDKILQAYQHASTARNNCIYDFALQQIPSTHEIVLEKIPGGKSRLVLTDERNVILRSADLPSAFVPCTAVSSKGYEETGTLTWRYGKELTANGKRLAAHLPKLYKYDPSHLCIVPPSVAEPLFFASQPACSTQSQEAYASSQALQQHAAFLTAYAACLNAPRAKTEEGCLCDFSLKALPFGYSLQLTEAGQLLLLDPHQRSLVQSKTAPLPKHSLLSSPKSTLQFRIPQGSGSLGTSRFFIYRFSQSPSLCLFPFPPTFSPDPCASVAPAAPQESSFVVHFSRSVARFFPAKNALILVFPQELNPLEITQCSKPLVEEKPKAPEQAIFQFPAASKILTSCFGPRQLRSGSDYHDGIDFRGGFHRIGLKEALAMADGVVVEVEDSCEARSTPEKQRCGNGYGNFVLLKHHDTLYTRYSHLRTTPLLVDDRVTTGQTLGIIGSTGRSEAEHLDVKVYTSLDDAHGKDKGKNLLCYFTSDQLKQLTRTKAATECTLENLERGCPGKFTGITLPVVA